MSFLPLLDSVSYYKYMVISKTGQAKIFFEKGSILGLVVESQCFMLDGLFFTFICCKNCFDGWNDLKLIKKRPGMASKHILWTSLLSHFQVIQGYEQGVPGMCKGETRTLTVPSHLAYGDRGVPQAGIPGGATLHFTVELVSVTKGKLKSIHPNLHIDLWIESQKKFIFFATPALIFSMFHISCNWLLLP